METTKRRVHSWAALIAGLVSLAVHLLIVWLLTHATEPGLETHWLGLLSSPFTLAMLIVVVAAFSGNAGFRVAALTAALVSSPAPAIALFLTIWLFLLGLTYLPPIAILLIALILNLDRLQQLAGTLGALSVGFLAGLLMLASYWPIFTAYDGKYSSAIGGDQSSIAAGNLVVAAGLLTGAILLVLLSVLLARHSRTSLASHQRLTNSCYQSRR